MSQPYLLDAFNASQFAINTNLNGISQEESLQTPDSGGSCANWITGHLLSSREHILKLFGKSTFLTEEEAALYGRGSTGDKMEKSVDLERLKEGLKSTSETLLALLKETTPEQLAEEMDPKGFPIPVL